MLAQYKSHIGLSISHEKTSLLYRLQTQTLPDEAPPMGKIRPFSKTALTFEPVLQFGCPSGFRISLTIVTCSILWLKAPLGPLGRGGAVKIISQTISDWITEVEPGSAIYIFRRRKKSWTKINLKNNWLYFR